MKSSTGEYYVALDHVRAVAALMVFVWHFVHVRGGHLAPPPAFPLSLLVEGHTGVALFMTLSGYLFAKLLDGRRIRYRRFLWNRFLRLAPLLLVVVVVVGVQQHRAGADIERYARQVVTGLVGPTLPHGGWSITAEFHFYLVLPLLLALSARWRFALPAILIVAICVRALLHREFGEVQSYAFWTIVGRIDQFLLGILAYQMRETFARQHFFALATLFAFAAFYRYFDSQGGFYLSPSYPSPGAIWIYLPTVEGFGYAVAIAWYDNAFRHSPGRISRFVATIGTYSYSIYLLHFFFVFDAARFVDQHVVGLQNIHAAVFAGALCFFLMVPVGFLSYRLIESPFFRFRSKYIIDREDPEASGKS